MNGIDEDDVYNTAEDEAVFPDVDPYFQNQIYPRNARFASGTSVRFLTSL